MPIVNPIPKKLWKRIISINRGMALRISGHAEQESASEGAPSGAERTVPVRLKLHLPRIVELIRENGEEIARGFSSSGAMQIAS